MSCLSGCAARRLIERVVQDCDQAGVLSNRGTS
jgi:hypothetical protein